MSAVIVGLLFLTCGWKLYKDAIYTRYLALRNVGHPQYFGGALCAVFVFGLSFSLDAYAARSAAYLHFTNLLLSDLPRFADADSQGSLLHFARILMWALPVTWAMIRLLNWPMHWSPSLLMAVARKTRIIDELEETIYYCLRAKPPLSLALTTKAKKVYVGVPKRHSPDPDRDRVWIALWPLASGYRDDNGELHLTTFYRDVHKGGDKRTLEDYQVVLPIAEIQVAQAFDLLAYAKYQQKQFERERVERSNPYRLISGRLVGTGSVVSEPATPPTISEERHSQLFRLADRILSPRDRYQLRMYAYFVTSLALLIILLPCSHLALYYLAVATAAAFEAIEPAVARVAKWLATRRALSPSDETPPAEVNGAG